MALLFACQMYWICFQDNPAWQLPFFRENCLWCFSFDAQPLCMIECWKTSICQSLNVPFIPHSISCFRILKNEKSFTKIAQPSRFNVCFRGVFASVHGQQLHSLEASVKLLLVIHLYILCEAVQDKTWDYNPLILIYSLKKFCINLTLLINWSMKYKWTYQ